MTRKDTILIAVVINAGLLAILFTTAVIYDTDKSSEHLEFVSPLVDNKNPSLEPAPSNLIAAVSTGDEVDNVLKYYTTPASQPIVVQTQPEIYLPQSMALQASANDEDVSEPTEITPSQEQLIEVTVKRGDVLEKIAKSHKTSVAAIKRVNHLESERLSIGQVLKIPGKEQALAYANSASSVQAEPVKIEPNPEVKKELKSAEPVYYIVKSGDNPWKIAKQFGVKYDEILRLNHLDEDKARNLKIGDRIRVK